MLCNALLPLDCIQQRGVFGCEQLFLAQPEDPRLPFPTSSGWPANRAPAAADDDAPSPGNSSPPPLPQPLDSSGGGSSGSSETVGIAVGAAVGGAVLLLLLGAAAAVVWRRRQLGRRRAGAAVAPKPAGGPEARAGGPGDDPEAQLRPSSPGDDRRDAPGESMGSSGGRAAGVAANSQAVRASSASATSILLETTETLQAKPSPRRGAPAADVPPSPDPLSACCAHGSVGSGPQRWQGASGGEARASLSLGTSSGETNSRPATTAANTATEEASDLGPSWSRLISSGFQGSLGTTMESEATRSGLPLHPEEEDTGAPLRALPLRSKASTGTGMAVAAAATAAGSSPVVKLEKLIGKGAFGRVYRGLYRGERVAVKVLDTGLAPSGAGSHGGRCDGEEWAALRSLLMQEVEVLGRVSHPNVVRLLAACVEPPRLALVMELCETSLERLIYDAGSGPRDADGLIPLPTVLHIGIQLFQALAHLHPLVAHRDLKPPNVLLNHVGTFEPVVKLADFGLARVRCATLHTQDPEAGTPPYIAPENFDVESSVVLHQSDMYSAGVVLWEMLTGQKPWRGCELVDVAVRVAMKGERLPLDALPPERCPPKLRRLIEQCWERDPLRRPAAEEAAKSLVLVREQRERELRGES
ncbi:hypothetical protein HYH03_008547 [Edaphochlamys debaryana]|uniref:Protein kinase domain-containing protein n=1 Tax=Edaphochlamys debaryana TaxID=47281 RepID=A0A835Y1U7_9CHLO|nr:hypothetical protein HYH03_008547 [Edaphochlamys debaryana]|eukprot:KAG2493118.1 hypothetical protein HYH03_008547 [Edaphochlamys debaryana]